MRGKMGKLALKYAFGNNQEVSILAIRLVITLSNV